MSLPPRVFCAQAMRPGESLALDAAASRHVQVRRLQPGMALTLFDGQGHAFEAHVSAMGKRLVEVRILHAKTPSPQPRCQTRLVMGMPANERMDWLVEKATELGVRQITPLITQHSVLQLNQERAMKRQQHWLGIAQAACAQSGQDVLPIIDAPLPWKTWVHTFAKNEHGLLAMLSLRAQAKPWRDLWRERPGSLCVLSGPEGGLSDEEENEAMALGFVPVSLGAQTLRAETAPLAVLSQLL